MKIKKLLGGEKWKDKRFSSKDALINFF